MANESLIGELDKIRFNTVSWIFLKSDGNYENQIAKDRKNVEWIPSRGSAAIAKKTTWGDGVRSPRVILVDLDSKLLGLFQVNSPILEGTKVALSLWIDFGSIKVKRANGNPSGAYVSKEDLLKLLSAEI